VREPPAAIWTALCIKRTNNIPYKNKASGIVQDRPMRRGQTKRVVLDELKRGPQSASQLALVIAAMVPGISQKAATNRVYQALLRLEDGGRVCRDGGLWRLV